jgi:predicted RNA-binding protein with PIN domain
MRVLVVDGANVVGSRPTGWWRDRAGAATRLHAAIVEADLDQDLVVLVLEGEAKRGHPADRDSTTQTVHAPGLGDDTIVEQVQQHSAAGDDVVVVTADRLLRERVVDSGGSCVGPGWLLDRIG